MVSLHTPYFTIENTIRETTFFTHDKHRFFDKYTNIYLYLTLSLLKAVVGPFDWQLHETEAKTAIDNALMLTKKLGIMKAVCGDTGCGKTAISKEFCYNTKDAYYIQYYASMTMTDFLREVCEACGLKTKGRTFEMLKALGEHLKTKTKPLLIIDDIGKMSIKRMAILQQIYDTCERRLGIVLLGLPNFYSNLGKAAKNMEPGAAELLRRTGKIKPLRGATAREKTEIAILNGIDRQEVLELLSNKCTNLGQLHDVVQTIKTLEDARAEAIKRDPSLKITPELPVKEIETQLFD